MEIRPRGIQDMSWFKGSVLTPAERAARAKEADPVTADLAGFLLAQLDADVAVARAATPGPWDPRTLAHYATDENARHIALHNPAFELDRIAAVRAVVDEWRAENVFDNDPANLRLIALAGVLKRLARPYRGRPGWRDEWGTG